jgi:glutathione S-transferase
MKLYCSALSPYVRKVRVTAYELGLAGKIELVPIKVAPCEANREYADTLNPLRKIPALATDDGLTLFDSAVICEYLEALAGKQGTLIPREGNERWKVLTAHEVTQGTCDAALLVRYETYIRPEAARWPDWIDDQWDRVNAGLKWFEQRADMLEGDINLVQIALGCVLGYLNLRWPDMGWQSRFPHLRDWFAKIEQRPSFVSTRPE